MQHLTGTFRCAIPNSSLNTFQLELADVQKTLKLYESLKPFHYGLTLKALKEVNNYDLIQCCQLMSYFMAKKQPRYSVSFNFYDGFCSILAIIKNRYLIVGNTVEIKLLTHLSLFITSIFQTIDAFATSKKLHQTLHVLQAFQKGPNNF